MAALVGRLHDFDLAEDAIQETMVAALEHWSRHGPPAQAFAWAFVTARHKAIDILRRQERGRQKEAALATGQQMFYADDHQSSYSDGSDIPDERLKLIFTCCHPAIGLEAQVALTLKVVAGLRVSEIASSFLLKEATVAARLGRAKNKIREAGIPFAAPGPQHLAERLDAVLSVLYLIFTEGYAASENSDYIRKELCEEAIRLARMLTELMADCSEAHGLLALMLYQHSRRNARLNSANEIVPFDDQDRNLWDTDGIAEATRVVERSFRIRVGGFYQTQAHIAALHARENETEAVKWGKIVFLYDHLLALQPSPVLGLNRIAAVAKQGRLSEARAALDEPELMEALAEYPHFYSLRAALEEALGHTDFAVADYERAVSKTRSPAERDRLHARVRQLAR